MRATLSLFVLVLLVAAAGPLEARGAYEDSTGLPEEPIAGHIRGLLGAFESGDPDVAWRFIEGHFAPAFREDPPKDVHLRVFADVHESSRGYDFVGIRHYTAGDPPDRTVAIVRNRLTEAWEAFVLETEPAPPHRIVSLSVTAARPPSHLPAPVPLDLEQVGPALREFAQRMADADVFSGALLLARGDRVLLQGAWGQASKSYSVPNRVDTKFNLGSMNKMITAVAVAKLVEQGKLSFADPISKYLSADWLPKVDKTKVRVEHLLTHTSGLGNYFNEKFQQSSRALYREVDDFKPLVADETLAFEPGTDWRYSNTGMLVAGAIVASASARDYFDFVRREIYAPAGMAASDCYDMDVAVPNLAMGYSRERTPEGVVWRSNLFQHVIRGGPAGGCFSTVEDLYRFARGLTAGRLVKRELVETLVAPKPALSSPGYGYGFDAGGEPGGRIVGHSGGFPGISSNLDIYLDSGFVAIVLSNYSGGSQAIQQKMRELIARIPR